MKSNVHYITICETIVNLNEPHFVRLFENVYKKFRINNMFTIYSRLQNGS